MAEAAVGGAEDSARVDMGWGWAAAGSEEGRGEEEAGWAVVAAAQAPEAVKVAAALQWGRVAEAQVPLKMAALKIQRCQMRGGRRQCRGLQREDERRTAGLPLCAQRAQILPLLGLQGGGQSRHP